MKKQIHTPEGLIEEDYSEEDIAQQAKDEANMAKAIAEQEAYNDIKKSAKAKLIAGQPLTEEEANTLVI